MNRKLTLLFVLAGLASSAFGCARDGSAPVSPTEESSRVVARVNGEAVTLDDLDSWIKDQLFEQQVSSKNEAKAYDVRASALRQMVEDYAVDMEAARRGVTPAELIQAEVDALGPVEDDEVRAYYEEHRDRIPDNPPYEKVAPQIREYLEQEREASARASISGAADVALDFDPPRTQVAAIGPAIGPEDAPVTIVEFSDFQCPYCGRAVPILKDLVQRYPERLRVVYRHLPLSFHSQARGAAIASVCAQQQNQFWEYHDRLFENQRDLGSEQLAAVATELELDMEAFETCIATTEAAAVVDRDEADARAAGITGTPAFFVNGILLSGVRPTDDFIEIIESELARSIAGS